MAEIGLAVVQTLFSALSCAELREICAIWGYKSKLQELEKTVTTIKDVLLDAGSQVLSKEQQNYISELKDALYEADDLFDEFVTLLELKQLQKSASKRSEFLQKVRRFFSSDKNQVSHAFRMFHKVQKVQKKLNAIADNHQKFSLNIKCESICMRKKETCSYINVSDIIGRDDDKNAIIDQLLESKDQHVRFLTIVGVGGLGKTALAQLVYNDDKIKNEFGDSTYWVCVSDDQHNAPFELKTLLCKLLEELVSHKKSFDNTCSLQNMQNEFNKQIKGKKYFLVLDDVWNEDRFKWEELENLLILGQGGSRVLVTTRSEKTATRIRNGYTHMLKGLSRDDSWKLFQMTAFDDEGNNPHSVNKHAEMVEMGKKIVEKCNNIPLAIKVVGSLLFHEDISKWRLFQERALTEIDNDGDKRIMFILKFSYHNLTPSLKACFSYCAVFPKDFVIEKEFLINLWIAQGYFEPLNNGGKSVEDEAEEHFTILLRRCFFQDVMKDKYDEIEFVKIHDMMHDVAQEVGGKEFQVLGSGHNSVEDRTRHVTINDREFLVKSSSVLSNLRTLLHHEGFLDIPKDSEVVKWMSLRVLKLKYLFRGSSLNSIGKLLHLRYLDISSNHFAELPNSIAELHNLQMLILNDCSELRRLPHDFGKLEKLIHLNLANCKKLTELPHDFRKLVKLSHLILDGCKELTGMPLGLDRLKKIGALTSLVGTIDIEIGESCNNVEVMKELSGEYLSKIPGLKEVKIYMKFVDAQAAEAALEKLEPHPNLKELDIGSYGGRTIPWWRSAKDELAPSIQLSNLVFIHIFCFNNLVNLPSFSKLPFLESLSVVTLNNLEYMETRSSSLGANDTTFFPSLLTLVMDRCSKLKGWFREEGLGDADCGCWGILSFPCLSKLIIFRCPNMTSFPPCPTVETIILKEGKNTLQLLEKMMGKAEEDQGEVSIGNHTSTSSATSSRLATLDISGDDGVESLSEYEKVFQMCASSLRSLEIEDCPDLSRFSRGLEHLTALESLRIVGMDKLDFSEDNNEDIMAWKPLQHTLHSLTFYGIPNMKSLPEGMKHLTSLQTLNLESCTKLKGLPEGISSLSSLQSLTIVGCDDIQSLPEGFETLTSLKTLELEDCTKLKGLPEGISSLSSLQSLDITGCDDIQSLPEGFETLTCLNRLTIMSCRGLVERLKKPNGHDWQKIQHIPNLLIIPEES